MNTLRIIFILFTVFSFSCCTVSNVSKSSTNDRGEVGTYKNKFIWTGTDQAFVPNYIMIDALFRNIIPQKSKQFQEYDYSLITEEHIDKFINEFMHGHGFNGIHLPVFGQWFHIGDNVVTEKDSIPDPKTFDKLAMIIKKVYQAGGSTYLWVWGDHQRRWTSKSTKDGVMGKQEQAVMDMIAEKLGPLKGWFMGYGFDLWEWVTEEDLKKWHDYMWSKPGWNHLLGARSGRLGTFSNGHMGAPVSNKILNQIYEGLDFSDYELFRPSYEDLIKTINTRPTKPSLAGDRYRVRNSPPSPYPWKDYSEDMTRRGLWYHTMAGGIGAIWGNMDSTGVYSNKDELKCFSVFWNDNNRFRKDMIVDNEITNGYCLRDADNYYVFYKENTNKIEYGFSGKAKKVIAVDTKKKYEEINLGTKKSGNHVFNAPYVSDWAIAVEENRSIDNLIFTDITKETGFGGPAHPDSLGGHGISWSDVTKNGFPDVYVTMNWKGPNIAYPDLFYINNGKYHFKECAAKFGIDDVDGGSHGAVFADLNNDGYYDLINGSTLALEGGPSNNRVYENIKGKHFIDRTNGSMKETREYTRGVGAFDFDKNGLLDIVFISGWQGSNDPPGEKNELYMNQGNFNFVKSNLDDLQNAPAAQGVTTTDFDGDGNIDILSCNRGGDLVILRNDGDNHLTLVDPAELGIRHTAYSGITTGDLNNDGHLDMILVNDPGENRLNDAYIYINNGNGTFTHTYTFKNVSGYMAGLADLDLDTFLDIVFPGHPYIFLNNGDGTFRKGPKIPINNINDPRCVAFADIDNDGDPDFAFAVKRDLNRLYRNDYSGDNRWLKINMCAPNGQAGAFGAKIYLYGQTGELIGMREAKSSYGYLAQDDPIIHFGTGNHKKVTIKIMFVTGEVKELTNIKTNKSISIR